MKLTDEQKAILDADHKLTIEQLKEKYGGEDGEHPVLTRALFESDKRLLFGDPKYWPYVETCLQINYSKYERPSRVQAIKCYGESEVIDWSRPLMIDSPECWADMGMTSEEGIAASLGLHAPKLIDPDAPIGGADPASSEDIEPKK